MRKRMKGFTLIELMVVIVIAAILLGLAVMNFGRFTPGMRFKDAQEKVLGAMRTGRLRAITKETSSRVILYSDGVGGGIDSFDIWVMDPRTKLNLVPVWAREGRGDLPRDVYLSAGTWTYTFRGDGSVAVPGGPAPRLASQTRAMFRCSLEVTPASGLVKMVAY